jgi:5-methyltetrahydropteroyltriglutamate--homocysteine methyltransferase
MAQGRVRLRRADVVRVGNAGRFLRFVDLVGRERVIASTDCGLGGRVHPDIGWAKLDALVQGAALATRQLWR